MRKKLGRAAVMTAVVGLVGLGLSQVAEAAVLTTSLNGIVGQVDTHPGNGEASWVYGHANAGATGGVQYEFYDGVTDSFGVSNGSTHIQNTGATVWRSRVYATNSLGNTSYGAWQTF
ncbi:hypothetical protein ACFVHS_38705 [Streptomyces sp. NPDC057746]|uniref:hypothetical protein n=1 Tax=Streptomyces sp. NPDC057746 TaxID=3346237 RepID=UPI0036CC2BA9